MTLPELLISVVIVGLLVTAIAASATVVLRTTDNTEGRLNNARSEQSVGIFMPSDLTSAENVNTDVGGKPCGPQVDYPEYTFATCPGTLDLSTGSNTMLLTWFGSSVNAANQPVQTVTLVSYRYRQDGEEWVLDRVECNATETGSGSNQFGTWSCESAIVLHDMKAPPAGVTFIPGGSDAVHGTAPEWVIKVTSALGATDATLESADVDDPGMSTKNAKRVLVTIDGGARDEGTGARGGGEKTFSFSAGGTDRDAGLSISDLSGAPTFTATRTRCGGNFGLIVDRSSSIGAAWTGPTGIQQGLKDFVDTFAGKPVRLQIVAFAGTSMTVGATTDPWTRYFDMLNTQDVTDLKNAIGVLGLGSGTNWEEGWFRMLRNPDGTLRSIVPDKVIFFTDGMPNRNRTVSNGWTGNAIGVADPRDAGISTSFQVAWNRTARLIDDSGVTKIVGVYVTDSSEGATSQWETAGAGYVYQYEVGNTVQYQQGFTATYERGNTLTFQRGYHDDYQRAASGITYEYGYTPTYQRRTDSKLVFERYSGGSWKTTYNGNTITWATYIANNSTAGDGDNWRARLASGGTATWGTITSTEYAESNLTADETDGFRMLTSYTAPFGAWQSTDWATYIANNTNNTETDGWRARVSGTPGTWTSITQAEYNETNIGADSTDGFQIARAYSSPYSAWEASDWTNFSAGNTTSAETDGWRTQVSGTPTTWTAITQAQYTAANSTTTEADGFRTNLVAGGTGVWQATTQAAYEAGNTTSASTDGWRTIVSGTPASWAVVTKSLYDESNTTANDSTDGWRRTKLYPETGPWDGFENHTLTTIDNQVVLERLVAPAGPNYPTSYDAVNGYGDVSQVNMFAETDWSRFGPAIRDVALAECGGTVTIQTRNSATNLGVNDTFTYGNQLLQTVETSASYRSGTFDVVLPGADPADLVITQQRLSSLNAWTHVGWSCTSKGQPMPASDMHLTDPDGDGWPTLTLRVTPNTAISCIHRVAPK